MSTWRPTPDSRVVAVIPARGGSVSIPRKNIKPLAGRCASSRLTLREDAERLQLCRLGICTRRLRFQRAPHLPCVGRPLIDWVIKPALHCGIFSEVYARPSLGNSAAALIPPARRVRGFPRRYVSTDDDAIAAVAEKCGAKVHRRDPATATSTASTESALIDFAEGHPDFDVLCLIQATSPFITPRDFISGWELMRVKEADSLVTAVRAHRFLWSVDKKSGCESPRPRDPLASLPPVRVRQIPTCPCALACGSLATAKNYEPLKRPRRQDWDGELVENGAFYMTTKACLEKHKCRLGDKMVRYVAVTSKLRSLGDKIVLRVNGCGCSL